MPKLDTRLDRLDTPRPLRIGARRQFPDAGPARVLKAVSSLAAMAAVTVLAGCASPKAPSGWSPMVAAPSQSPSPALSADADGPPLQVPPGLERTPDAVPRIEPLRAGGPNKPYEALGRRYVPMTADEPLLERGGASWYGRKYHGRPTSSGEPYDMFAMTAAHPTMPIPSYARVTNPANGRQVIVRVNDRGPFVPGRVIDLSYTAALRLDLLRGVAPVEVERLTHEAIRAHRLLMGEAAGEGLSAPR
ncbi:MAG: hypothetical protein RL087_919 [Pseudomonadota bacterium]